VSLGGVGAGALAAAWTAAAGSVLAMAWRPARGRTLARLREGPAPPGGRGADLGARLARRLPAAPALVARLCADAEVGWPPAAVWVAWLAATAAGLVVGVTAGIVPAGLLAGACAAAPGAWLWARRGRAAHRLEAALPPALEVVARGLRSGASLPLAIAECSRSGPPALRPELGRVVAQVDRGAPLAWALDELARRRPLAGVQLAVAALGLGAATGGAQARALDGVALTLRERLGVAAEVRAQAAQARTSAAVLGLVPLAFGAFASVTDPRTAELLFRTPLGWGLLAAGVSLDALGWWWMRRITGLGHR